MSKIKIILVDDHDVVRTGIKVLLMASPDISIIGEAGNGDELFRLLESYKTDILILDIVLPGMNGIEITKRLHKEYPDIKVIIFSGNTPEEIIFEALEAGAYGIIPKNASQDELVSAIFAVFKGEEYFTEEIAKVFLRNFRKQSMPNASLKEVLLSDREIEVVRAFAEGKSYKEIANYLHISTHTVESHKNNILKKLELKTIIDLVKYAIKSGIVQL